VSVGRSIQRSPWVLLAYCLVMSLFVPSSTAASEMTSANAYGLAQADVQQAPTGLSFVSAFSSTDDAGGPSHPVLNRTLDIVAGPKDPALRRDALQSPSGVTTDSNGRVFVADPGAKAVHIFDFAHSKYGLLDRGSDRLGIPIALTVDAQDNLYVIDERSRTVLVYDAAGKFRRSLGTLSGGESYFESPAGIAIDPTNGHIYVCDKHRHMIIVMDDRGRLIGKAGKRGGGDRPGDFRLPTQAVIAAGELFVLDEGNARVQIFDAALHFRRAINLTYADHRTGLAVDGQGSVYVSDPVLNRIQVFSQESRLLYTFDPGTIKVATFSRPSALWVQAGSCLYVVDSQYHKVGLFQISGENTRQCR
jgi:DNA-binding beta-propeller fold protein YncE